MKVTQDQGPAPLTSGTMDTVDIGLSDSPEDQLMILNVLSNTLYTNKVAAVLREYGCNAFDANVEADRGDKPILVKLPTMMSPTVVIRDYGFGMTEEQVYKTFCKVGRSTKRNSNAYTGMLGIGSKAGFAYGDSFTVTSHATGLKTIYTCYRDNMGALRATKMHEEKTREPDGVEIEVPVKQADITTFQREAATVFQYFKVRPKFERATVTFDESKYLLTGKGWRFIGDNHDSVAIMGNVGYDVDPTSLHNVRPDLLAIVDAGVELDFHIGELEIAANREGLQYRDATCKAIMARLQQVQSEVVAVFTQKLASAKSMWEAKIVYDEIAMNHTMKKIVGDKATWNGQPIGSHYVPLMGSQANSFPAGVSAVNYRRDPYYKRMRKTVNPATISANKRHMLCINDLPRISPSRVRGFFEANKDYESVTIFTFDTAKTQADYWSKFLKDAQFTVQSSYPIWHDPNAGTGGSSAPSAHRSKHSKKAFTLNEKGPGNVSSDANSLWWETCEVDLETDGGVFVWIEKFEALTPGMSNQTQGTNLIRYGGTESPRHLRDKVIRLRAAGLIKGPVYGFKKDYKDKLGPKWVPLHKSIESQMTAINTTVFQQALSDYFEARKYRTFIEPKHHTKFVGNSLHVLLSTHLRMLAPALVKVCEEIYANNCGPWLKGPVASTLPKPTVALIELENRARHDYPMLQLFEHHDTAHMDNKSIDTIAEYVRLVDQQ